MRPLPGAVPRDHRPLYVQGMKGLGDNIMQRPFIKAAAEREPIVYLQTPWPELFADLPNVRPVRSATRLRTQAKNEARSAIAWSPIPARAQRVVLSYTSRDLAAGSVSQAFERALPLGSTPYVMDLPAVGQSPRISTGGKPLAVIRPATIRAEWTNPARNPRPEYICQIAEALAPTHFVVCVADLEVGKEWLAGHMPVCDLAFMHGELSTMDVLALMASADVLVGGVGFLVPAALALKVPAFVVLGGQGGHNAPEVIVDPRADASRLGWAFPANYCRCAEKSHDCPKSIDGILELFGTWARSQGVSYADGCNRPTRRRRPALA